MKHIILILSFLTLNSFALTKEQLTQIQTNLESRINPIIHTFDPNAILFVKLRTTRRTSRVSLIPFLMDNISVPGESVTEIQKVEIVLLSDKKEIPKPVVELLREIASDMGVRVNVKLRALPDELNKNLIAEKEKKLTLKSDTHPVKPTSGYTKIWRVLSSPAAIPLAILMATLLLGAVMLRLFWYLKKGTDELALGLGQVADALEHQPPQIASHGTAFSKAPAEVIPFAKPELVTVQEVLVAPDLSLMALLSDCYWSKFDSYAAYLWGHTTENQKKGLLAHAAFVRDYSDWLSEVPPNDLGVAKENYYAQPLAIAHLDNAVLTKLVRENPALLYKLPSLRRSGLELSLSEKVEVTKLAIQEANFLMPVFEDIPASSPRALSKRISISLNSVAEESEVLKIKNASTQLAENLPTLGWWNRIDEKALEEVLAKFSARELATAWIGPQEVLARFAKAMPRHKHIMVLAYLRRIAPSRSSVTYKLLHQQAIRHMEKMTSVSHTQETKFTAAPTVEAPALQLNTTMNEAHPVAAQSDVTKEESSNPEATPVFIPAGDMGGTTGEATIEATTQQASVLQTDSGKQQVEGVQQATASQDAYGENGSNDQKAA